jgi:hypothetical protein
MNFILLFIAVNLIGLVNSASNNYKYPLMARNTALRFILSNEYKKTEFIVKNFNIFKKYIYEKIQRKTISKYYDLWVHYYSLTEDDKTILENIISLCY